MSEFFCTFARNFAQLNMKLEEILIDIKWLVDGWSIAKIRSLGQEETEAYCVVHAVQDSKDVPPRMAIYTTYHGEKYPLCYGFCALLIHWATGEIFNRKVRENAESMVYQFEDFCFEFEEFIPVNDLIKAYLEKVKFLYTKWLGCSPRKAHLVESDDELFSKIFFDEYEFYYDFLNTMLVDQFNRKQKEDFIDYWLAFRNYLVRHYHISAKVKDLPLSLIKNFVAIGHIELPEDMTVEEFAKSSAVLNVGTQSEQKEPEPKVIRQSITMNFNGPVGQAIANVEQMVNTIKE